MARRWLRSPRMRNTFIFQPARPAPSRSQLQGNFLWGKAVPRPPPGLWVRSAPHSARAPPLRQRSLGPAVTWPGQPHAKEPGSAFARCPAPGPSQRLGYRAGGAAWPGWGLPAWARRPPPRRLCAGEGPATSRTSDARSPGSASLLGTPSPPARDLGQTIGPLSLPQFPHLYTVLIIPVPP